MLSTLVWSLKSYLENIRRCGLGILVRFSFVRELYKVYDNLIQNKKMAVANEPILLHGSMYFLTDPIFHF